MGGQQTSAAKPGLWQEMMDKYNRAIQPRPDSIMAPKESWSDWAVRQGARGIDLGVQAEQDPSKLIDWATAPIMEKLDKPVRAGAKQVLGKYGDPVATGLEVAVPALSYASGLMAENPAFMPADEPPIISQAETAPIFGEAGATQTRPMLPEAAQPSDRPAIQFPDDTVMKGQYGETHDELVERMRSSIAKQFERTPDLAQKFDRDFFHPETRYGFVTGDGEFYLSPEGRTTPYLEIGGQTQPLPTGDTGRLASRPTQEGTTPTTQYLAGDPFGRGTAELAEGVPGLKRPTYTGPLPELGGDLPERFHGSSEPIQMMMNPQEGSYGGHLYGAGLYTTDNYNVAGGYAQHEGPIYSIHEIRPVKMFNVEDPLPPSVAIDMYDNTLDDHWLSFMSAEDRAPYLEDYETVHGKEYEPEHFGMGVLYPRNPGGGVLPGSRIIQGHEPLPIGYWYDNMRQRLPDADAAEQEEMLRRTLSREGYGGFEHVGGRRSGLVDHRVKIYWNPKDDIRMRHLLPGFSSPEGEYVPSGFTSDPEDPGEFDVTQVYRYPAPEVPGPYLGRRRQPLPGSYYPEQFSWNERVSPNNMSDLYDYDAMQPEPGYHYSGVDLGDVRQIQEDGLEKNYTWTTRPHEGVGQTLIPYSDALIRVHEGAGEWELSDPNQPFQLTDIGPEKIEIRTRQGWKPIKSMQLPRSGY